MAKNSLTRAQSFQLTLRVQEHFERDGSKPFPTWEKCFTYFAQVCGHPVTKANLRSACTALSKELADLVDHGPRTTVVGSLHTKVAAQEERIAKLEAVIREYLELKARREESVAKLELYIEALEQDRAQNRNLRKQVVDLAERIAELEGSRLDVQA